MRIAHLSVGDPFTARLVNSQVSMGHDVHLIMLKPPTEDIKDVKQYMLPFGPPHGYYLNTLYIRRLLKKIRPDLLHVHYATGNGTLGRLSKFCPSILSVWGSDILIAPHESKAMQRRVIKNLKHYNRICSTSTMLTKSTRDLCSDIQIHQIPIGVDTAKFAPSTSERKDEQITVGTVKSLHPVYGIDILILAFAHAREELKTTDPQIAERLRLRIVGDGPLRGELESLVANLNIQDVVEFAGYIQNDKIPDTLREMDIFVALSRSESFGVAVVEASACALPVIVSDVGGLPEVARDGTTGFIVKREDPTSAKEAIVKLVKDARLRKKMGQNGRSFVMERYEWKECMQQMNQVYEDLISNN